MPKISSPKSTAKVSTKTVKREPSSELVSVINSINKKFGEGTISFGVPERMKKVDRIPTGNFSLDLDLGGGIPVGRFIEISGKESSSKTTQVCHIVREAQKLGYVVAWADVEGTSDKPYFESLGIDCDSLLYFRPSSTEEATEVILQLQRSGNVQLGVLDSIAQMTPNIEQNSGMDETVRMGVPQQLLGEFLRKWNANNNKLEREGNTPFTLVGINQIREKIGSYGNPEYSPGGNAKNFTASVQIHIRKGDLITEGTGNNKEIVGQVIKYKVVKNKTYRDNLSGEFDFYKASNSAGVEPLFNDNYKSVVLEAINYDIIERKGAWFYYKENKYQGVDSLVDALKNSPEILGKLKEDIISNAYKGIE